jgi:hypothetical protein
MHAALGFEIQAPHVRGAQMAIAQQPLHDRKRHRKLDPVLIAAVMKANMLPERRGTPLQSCRHGENLRTGFDYCGI